MANPFRVFVTIYLFPGLSLRSNPGLKLAHTFGVTFKALPYLCSSTVSLQHYRFSLPIDNRLY